MAQNQPRSYDVVLGGQTPTPINAAVLGGVAGVKRRLTSQNVTQRVAALQDAPKYGQAGLDLIFKSLQDESWQVRKTAYLLLQDCEELTLKQAFQEYNPYQLFECLHKHSTVRCIPYSVAISADGQLLVSGGSDRNIIARSLYTGRMIRTLSGHTDGVKSVAITPSGQTIISSSWDNTVKVWNLQQSKTLSNGLLYKFVPHEETVNCLALSPDGQILATGSEDNSIKLWNLSTRKLIHHLAGHEDGVKAIAISPIPPSSPPLSSSSPPLSPSSPPLVRGVGGILTSASADETIKIWDLTTGELLKTLTGHKNWVKCLAISPDGKTLISGAQDKTIKLWNLPTGELINTLTGHWDEVNSVAISRDGNTLVSGGGSLDQTLRIWHLKTGTQLHNLEGHHDAVSCVSISPDGEKIVSSSWDQTIRVWGVR